jgi:hypothetical protein
MAHGDVAKVEILVNARLVKTCPGHKCEYVGGPYPEGTVTYGASAYDEAGNRAWTGYQSLTVKAAKPARRLKPAKPPEPEGGSTISGRLTGQTDLARRVSAYNLDQPSQHFTASIAANGEFEFFDLPDGHYRVRPTAGKVEVISEPMYREVRCRGRQSHTVNFEIKGIDHD